MGFSIPPYRNIFTGDSAGVSDPKGNLGGVWYRASPADGSPLPVTPPAPTTTRGLIDAIGLLTGEGVLGMWAFNDGSLGPPSYKDMAWRWVKHDAELSAPSGYAAIDSVGTLFTPVPFHEEIGGGSGPVTPWIAAQGQAYNGDVLIDPHSAPTWSVVVEFSFAGPVDNNGNWNNFSTSMSATPPSINPIPQPIIAWGYDNTWRLTITHQVHWSGGPGAWVEDGIDVIGVYANNYQVGSGPIITADPEAISSGIALLEFDSVAKTISFYTWNAFAHEFVLVGQTLVAEVFPFGLAPIGTVLGAGTTGPYYWTYYTHLSGYIISCAIIPNGAEFTTDLLSKALLVPGTGPATLSGVGYRANTPSPDGSVSSRLSEYAHYWPLDDPSPGPMMDVVAGSRLSVVNPIQVTFQVDGISPTSTNGHVEGVHLSAIAGAFGAVTSASLVASGTPLAALGAGGLGHDFTFAMLVKWEGPVGFTGIVPLITSSTVPSIVDETAISIWIGTAIAEPIGVTFQTWDTAGHAFDTLATTGFDWPAEYFRDGGGIPQKAATWALLTVVYRTVGASIQKEIWVDGVLLKTGIAAVGGWGQNVNLAKIGGGFKGALQNLAFWPFALTAAEIAGL